MPEVEAPRPALSHLRICDFGGQLAGAGATKILAAFGAQVIRIEDPVTQGRWDALRGVGPFVDERRGVNLGGGFNNHNVGKLGVTINLRTEAGRQLVRELVTISDAVTENFAAGVLARRGFGYDVLREIRPDIVYVTNCGFGHTGPYRAFKTWGPIVQAVSGLTFSVGLPDAEPAGYGFSYMDHGAAFFMATAVLAALHHRNRTGEGQWVDLASAIAGMTMLPTEILDSTVNGRPGRGPGRPGGNRADFSEMAPHGVYPARGDDRWLAIACRDDEAWKAMSGTIGAPWASDDRYTTLDGRLAHEEALDGAIAAWTARFDAPDLAARLVSAGVPASVVKGPQERTEDPELAAWGLFPEVEHPEMGAVPVEGLPLRFSATPWSIVDPAPCVGEDNDLVFGELLGRSEAELDELREAGAI